MNRLSAEDLTAKWKNTDWYASRDPEHELDPLNLRVHRAIRWIERAEDAHRDDDHDVAFILYWIAFNAAYGQTGSPTTGDQPESDSQRDYIRKIIRLDDAFFLAIRSDDVFQSMIKILLSSRFVFEPFWKHHNEVAGCEDWKEGFDRSKKNVTRDMREIRHTTIKGDVRAAHILHELFKRLYTLRNQLLHGGATWGSSKNRNQVRLGASPIALLVPRFIDVMIENSGCRLGLPALSRCEGLSRPEASLAARSVALHAGREPRNRLRRRQSPSDTRRLCSTAARSSPPSIPSLSSIMSRFTVLRIPVTTDGSGRPA